jgi:hypothetical protein
MMPIDAHASWRIVDPFQALHDDSPAMATSEADRSGRRITVSVSNATYDQIAKLAKHDRRSMAGMIKFLLEEVLANGHRRGAAAPSRDADESSRRTSVRVSTETYDQIAKLAKQDRRSMAGMIKILLDEALASGRKAAK